MNTLRLAKAFAVWIAKAFFGKLAELNYEFKKELKRHPALAIMLWIVLSIFWISILGFTSVALVGSSLGFTVGLSSTILYLVYAIFSNLYTIFKQERRELFETIKNS